MEKDVRKKIEYAFYNYEKLVKLSAKEIVDDLAYKNIAVSYDKVAVQSSAGKTMQDRICELVDEMSENYRWAKVVEKTLEHFEWDCRKQLIIEKYFRKKGKIETITKIGISERTCSYWLEDILTLAYRWAEKFKLLGERQ